MKYMRDNLEDKYGFLRLQEKILEIAVYIHDFCKKNDIDYCLMGGSALGAKRHGGFIPWDDDLDIFMTVENYEKFRRMFNETGDKTNYYLQECGRTSLGHVTVPKFRMNGTTYYEELTKDWDIHSGIFVDIFILHNCPDCKTKQLWQCFWAKCAVVKGNSMRNYSRQEGFKQFLISVAKILPKKIMVDFALKQVYLFEKSNSNYYCNFLGKAIYKKGLYKKEWFDKTESVPFEKIELHVPIGLHDFLTERFGDYMQIPSLERIKWEQHSCYWSIEQDFRELSEFSGDEFNDEKRLV